MAEMSDATSRQGIDHTIVDCDIHTSYRTKEIRQKIAKRLEEPYRSHLLDETLNYGPYPRDSFPKEPVGESNYTESSVVGGPDDIRRDLMGGMGIDMVVLNSLQKFDLIPSTERATREMRAVNDVFIEHFLDSQEDFYGLAMLSTKDPAAAADELDRLGGEKQIVGALMLNGPSVKPLGHPMYDPIYKAAERNGLPVVFHTSAVGYALDRKFPFMFNDLERYATLHTLSHPFANMVTVASLVMNGVPEKFPGLDFVFLEQDLGIVPLMTYRMNREVQEKAQDVPLLTKSPEQYVREQFYFGTQPLPESEDIEHARRIIDMIGPDSILFSTDHPHPDFDDPEWVINRYFGHLDDAERASILGQNAADVFGLDI